ncbi:MAG: hypothetical protein K0Q48_384 [Bacillota bacterium]|nr:hypothetical protein [Bacillota bacterium]
MTDIESTYFIAIFLIYFASFFVKGIAGFGDPLILNPMLSMFLDNKQISPANLLLSVPINAYMAWSNRKYFALRKIIPVAVFLVLGIIPGTMMLKYATSWLLKISLGLIVILIGVQMLLKKKDQAAKSGGIGMAFMCFLSGVTSGLYGINLFIIAYIERTSSNRNEFRGNLCFVFALDNLIRMITYFAGGIFTKEICLLALTAIPGVVAGLYAGSRLDRRLGEETVRLIVISIFILGGLSIVIKTLIEVI